MSRMQSSDYPEGYWERGEGSNYHDYADDPGWDVILRVMRNSHVPGDSLIEMACAKGYFVQHARQRGFSAVGFDLSEYAISKAPGDVQPYVVQHNAAESWPWSDAQIDIVCGWEFLEHIPEDELPSVLVNAVAALKEGGELWLKTGIVIPGDHPFAGQTDNDHTHCTVRDRAWWEEQLAGLGLEHLPEQEAALDEAFRDRDWFGRFFVWRKPFTT